MKVISVVVSFVALVALSGCVPIEPTGSSQDTDLLDYESVQGREMYRFKYETNDGQFREEVGMLVNVGTPEQELMVMGQYGFKSKDGSTLVMVKYTSDKKGYRARTVTRSAREADLKNNKAFLSLLKG
uniref:Uncharacterized protein n=1 Tax=Anopheles funestus TaxID=62324 RepID=A0A182REH7_ANOFN